MSKNTTNDVPMLGFLGCSCCHLKHKGNGRAVTIYCTAKTAEFHVVLCFSVFGLLFLFIPLKWSTFHTAQEQMCVCVCPTALGADFP